jgi:hypothetical protein
MRQWLRPALDLRCIHNLLLPVDWEILRVSSDVARQLQKKSKIQLMSVIWVGAETGLVIAVSTLEVRTTQPRF